MLPRLAVAEGGSYRERERHNLCLEEGSSGSCGRKGWLEGAWSILPCPLLCHWLHSGTFGLDFLLGLGKASTLFAPDLLSFVTFSIDILYGHFSLKISLPLQHTHSFVIHAFLCFHDSPSFRKPSLISTPCHYPLVWVCSPLS